jgi:hypothetical protein
VRFYCERTYLDRGAENANQNGTKSTLTVRRVRCDCTRVECAFDSLLKTLIFQPYYATRIMHVVHSVCALILNLRKSEKVKVPFHPRNRDSRIFLWRIESNALLLFGMRSALFARTQNHIVSGRILQSFQGRLTFQVRWPVFFCRCCNYYEAKKVLKNFSTHLFLFSFESSKIAENNLASLAKHARLKIRTLQVDMEAWN